MKMSINILKDVSKEVRLSNAVDASGGVRDSVFVCTGLETGDGGGRIKAVAMGRMNRIWMLAYFWEMGKMLRAFRIIMEVFAQ